MKKWKDKDGYTKRCYKLTMSKDGLEVVQINRGISTTSFSQINVISMDDSIRFGS